MPWRWILWRISCHFLTWADSDIQSSCSGAAEEKLQRDSADSHDISVLTYSLELSVCLKAAYRPNLDLELENLEKYASKIQQK